ncbi:MAG: ATP-binding protein [Nitrosomonadaceae bacterium]|nr:ATP-binding protein [Nitrosomonadaceae bacterium]
MLLIRDDRKISIIGGLLLMGLTLATGIAVYGVMRQQIESTLGRGLDVALQGKARLFESQIAEGLASTRALATRPFLVQSMQQLNAQPDNANALHDLERNVDSLTQAGFSAATVYDVHGNELAQVGRFSSNQTPSLPLHSHNNTSLLWDGQFILRTSKDVLDQDGRRIGSISTEKPLPQLTRNFSEIRAIGKTGEFMLCAPPGKGGQEMSCLLSQLGGVKFKHLPRVPGGMPLPMNYVLEGKSGVITVKDYRQVPVIAAYAPLGVFALGMVLKLDEEELFRPVTEQLKIIVLYLAGLIIAEMLLLYWLVRKLIRSEREARDAKESAEQFSTELSHKELALRERLKEITCLYEIRRGMGLELSLDNVCQQIFEHLMPAMQFPEIAAAVIELDGRRFTSGNHGQSLTHELQSKISVNGKVCGQLRVFYPEDKPFLVLEEQRLIDAIASDLERWLERKQIDEMLRERLKEITCLYEIRRGMGLELSLDNVCQQIFEHLIPAMQFPEIATAVIELDGRRFTSGNHGQGLTHGLQSKISINNKVCLECYKQRDAIGFVLQSNISVNGKVCGQLRVFYPEDKPFLVLEEQRLIDAIANDLGSWLERNRLEQALVSIAEEQQRLIGQELHDNLGQQIAAIGYQAKALEKKISASGSVDAATVATSIATQAQIAVMQCKQLAQGLLPFELETNGLIATLQAFASRIAVTYKITCDFVCKNEVLINDNNLALNLYRITQEAVNNAIRHGGAQHLAISLASEEGILRLSICDNGCGFAGADAKHGLGMGIKIMQYRARQIGATLEFLLRAEGGTEVRLEMRMV